MKLVRTIHCRTETTLYHQGEEHPWIYRINKGFVTIFALDIDGKLGVTDLYGPDNWFGPGLMDGGGHLALQGAKAHPGCVLDKIASRDLQALLSKEADMQHTLLQQLARREQQLQQRLYLQQTAQLSVRLAYLLGYLCEHQSQPCSHGHFRDMRLSQQDIAAMVGGSRQSVSQLLAAWKNDGIIDYTRSYLCIEDVAALRALCEPSP